VSTVAAVWCRHAQHDPLTNAISTQGWAVLARRAVWQRCKAWDGFLRVFVAGMGMFGGVLVPEELFCIIVLTHSRGWRLPSWVRRVAWQPAGNVGRLGGSVGASIVCCWE